MMNIHLVGVSHSTAPLAIREKAAIGINKLNDALYLLCSSLPHGVILSTCNRTEVYTVTIETTEIDSFGKDYISHKLFDNCREYKLPLVLAQAKNLYKNATIIH